MEEKICNNEVIPFSRRITKNNLRVNIKLLNLRYGLDSEGKFENMLNSCDDELAEEIVEAGISNWTQLENVYLANLDEQDNSVRICSKQRNKSEYSKIFVERMMNEFKRCKVSKEVSLRWLALNIWPGKVDFSLKLLSHKNYQDFQIQVSYLMEPYSQKKKIWCQTCKSLGHRTEKCNKNKS